MLISFMQRHQVTISQTKWPRVNASAGRGGQVREEGNLAARTAFVISYRLDLLELKVFFHDDGRHRGCCERLLSCRGNRVGGTTDGLCGSLSALRTVGGIPPLM